MARMGRWLGALSAGALLLGVFAQGAGAGDGVPWPPAVTATAAVVYDPASRQFLYEKHPNLPLMPASTTKILTAYLAIASGRLDRTVTVSAEAASQPGSWVPLAAGQRIFLRALLYGMMLRSGNDAAYAVAQAVAGSVPRFVALMNRAARALGATHTHFVNPDGMPDPGHLTTAHDLALITAAAMENPVFRRIVATRTYWFPGPHHRHLLVNENRLLFTYPGAIGVKTGYTIEAGETLVAAARRDGRTLIVVLLHDTPGGLWTDPVTLFNAAFAHFRDVYLVRAGQKVARIGRHGARAWAVAAQDVAVSVPVGQAVTRVRPRVQIRLPAGPVAVGSRVGTLWISARGDPVRAVPLVATAPLPPAPVQPSANPWIRLAVVGAGVTGGAWLLYRRRRIRRRRYIRRVRRVR